MIETDESIVHRQIVINAPIQRAFDVFVERFGDIKPREHNLLGSEIAETVFERHVGGHIYDRAVDGTECRWARILAFQPPDLVVFSWDISPQWTIESDPQRSSRVEVRFVAETEERTRLDLVHSDLDRHGPGWQSVREGVEGEGGWPLYLDRYAGLFPAALGATDLASGTAPA